MRYALRFALVLMSLTVVALVLLLMLPNDVVTNRYSTLQAARDDKLFVRGWMPEILPNSTFEIHASSNLDLNTSEGFFSFEPSDYALFKTHLQPYQHLDTPRDGFETIVISAGFETFVYQNDDSTWLFSCKGVEGFCKYLMRVRIN